MLLQAAGYRNVSGLAFYSVVGENVDSIEIWETYSNSEEFCQGCGRGYVTAH